MIWRITTRGVRYFFFLLLFFLSYCLALDSNLENQIEWKRQWHAWLYVLKVLFNSHCCCVSTKPQNIIIFKVNHWEISIISASQVTIRMSSSALPDQKSGRFPAPMTSFFSSSIWFNILPVLGFCLFFCLNIIHQLMHRGLGALIFPVFQRFKLFMSSVINVNNLLQCEAKTQGITLWIANNLFNTTSNPLPRLWITVKSKSTFSLTTKATKLKL